MGAETKVVPELSQAEIDLCGRWLYLYGDDPALWSDEVHEAFDNTLAGLLTGGAL